MKEKPSTTAQILELAFRAAAADAVARGEMLGVEPVGVEHGDVPERSFADGNLSAPRPRLLELNEQETSPKRA